MNIVQFAAECAKLAESVPDAEVLVDGWPVDIAVQPAYYDGPSKRYDEATNTLVFIRSGTKVMLGSLCMDDMLNAHPSMLLDTSALPDWQADRYQRMLEAAWRELYGH